MEKCNHCSELLDSTDFKYEDDDVYYCEKCFKILWELED